MTPMLQLQDVSRSFGGLKAVQGVSLSVPAGSLTALIGPNGAGKTTLFALMSGFLKPDSGTVVLDGRDITGQPPELNARAGMPLPSGTQVTVVEVLSPTSVKVIPTYR